MLQVLILVCSVSVSPPDCNSDTALDVIVGPDSASVMSCMLGSQAMLARTAQLGQRPKEYVKVRCSPPRPLARNS
ncbi:MAG: hypothetical protein M9924_06340 [Rhizobiaceae bacterium]|nr:hypothetical protein [Rhizobiaceae bacterium]